MVGSSCSQIKRANGKRIHTFGSYVCHEYFLNSKEGPITIKKCYGEKDQGVTFDTELNFNIHINTIVNKGRIIKFSRISYG